MGKKRVGKDVEKLELSHIAGGTASERESEVA